MKLDGIKVLDLSLFLPGPTLTQLMADHGADVIKLDLLAMVNQIDISVRNVTTFRSISRTRIAVSVVCSSI